ncbi:MAG: DUF1464 domain-containing protein [Nitrososphaeria archaeon]|nr:DUF1464 domain-containing protein [Nitrososphaeria archaeon]NIN51591.1 DUF1464 domain-containing protein [Nitrososphaeria archaeon]NIQ32076.1 DUF1464 domain-containing protein [Nitrososphaeria archaeon]
MVRVVGIDPGTKSMDVCALDDGEVYYEKAVDTADVAQRPEILIEAVEAVMPVDLISGPSGYGVEITYLRDIPEEILEDWYYEYILLTNKEHIEKAVEKEVFGALVYYAMTKSAIEMKRRDWPVCYIPGVIQLSTVPRHRKVNKMDMGTADKMCVAVLGVFDQAKRLEIPYSETSFIQVEVGFGYNAILGVEEGKIVDGIGGTTISGPGFLTIASMDAELVQLVGSWDKADVFAGGCASISGRLTPEELVDDVDVDENSKIAWDAMMEGVIKGVRSMCVAVPTPREILISGRLTKIKKVEDELKKELSGLAPVKRVGWLKEIREVKETAQGYAVVADGIAGGRFESLVEWMKIREAKGTAMDHIFHPKFEGLKERLTRINSSWSVK